MGFFDRCFCFPLLTKEQSVRICTYILMSDPKYLIKFKSLFKIVMVLQIIFLFIIVGFYCIILKEFPTGDSFYRFFIFTGLASYIIYFLSFFDYYKFTTRYVDELLETLKVENSARKEESL
ncbi:hypothetical protein BCR36DRAFT_373563 [Piromyces finnis]|uniref:Uncharacterized protein n=1 Tax=Piromyces finnis TaxID=1754191 RepID=A0A1Y1UZF9_9FUNG|nr:hypothetical protein BCR36DRAFT_373563 [Piromyces finnis]|eukprot:ORX43911.1 hypothetical protein BCR36DRAFT_373563 [Piromyces finnis]